MSSQRTKHPGVYVRHVNSCLAPRDPGERCRCQPSFRARRCHSVTGKVVERPSYGDINEALSWYTGAGEKSKPLLRERAEA
jgi:hypothetical protein